MTLSTSATPINGLEAYKMLEKQFLALLENTPGLEEGNSFHRFTCSGHFQIGAYPADVKTPAKEFEFDINSVSTNKGENEEVFARVKKLETIREELLHRLQEVTEELDTLNPVTRVEFDLNTIEEGQSVPDKLRVQQGMPIPVVVNQGGRNVEVYREVHKKQPGVFAFGRGRK